tara:strand:+ start:650 stop:874 length:225 start_codon:yes stop_codon:yes gene_type:complete
LSKIDVEVSDELEFEVGDCCIVIKPNGTIGKVILPEMNHRTPLTEGYKKMLKVIDILKPGAKKDFVRYNKRKLH